MQQRRRQFLRATGLLAASAGVAGCNGSTSTSGDATSATGTGTVAGSAQAAEEVSGASFSLGADVAVAAEWNAIRSRLDDAYMLGLGGRAGTGASVAQRVFARFENAGGEHGAHEFLESTSEDNYEGFEEALGGLQSALSDRDGEAAGEHWTSAQTNLRAAQLSVLGEQGTYAMDVLRFGAAANNLAVLAAAGQTDGASAAGEELLTWFEDAAAHDALESADGEAYESLEGALETARTEASSGNVEAARTASSDALSAATTGAYAMVDPDEAIGAGHIAAMQAGGFDAAVLASLGGPSTDYAHATTLTTYRVRAHDAAWLAARGETDTAQTMAQDVFSHFEGARAHEALEAADHEAYEGFEGGLESLIGAIGNGNSSGIEDALATVDENLVAGISALAGEDAALLEAAFFRARFADARELYRLGQNNVAASVAEDLFGRFEENELGVHERVESTSEELYTQFEEEHLSGLIDAFENTNDSGVDTHYEGVQSTLFDFQTTAGSTATVSAAGSAYMSARVFDAAALAALDQRSRAATVVQGAFEYFEGGAGGFHEALEDADGELYETFESNLGGAREAANNDSDVYSVATSFNANAIDAAYAVVETAGAASSDAAASLVGDAFAAFENASVHDVLEEADTETYETFESELERLSSTLEDGGDVRASVRAYADAANRAQFAVVGALDSAPAASSGDESGESGGHDETEYSGGPNVVEGVPDDADHVVDMQAVAFEPAELTVSVGDTVAWAHRAGEPHNVVAREDEIPADAEYWASGGFESESAANTGWENGEGAIQSGQSYTHTFETAGEHPYYCVPHEMAGMEGTIIVEE